MKSRREILEYLTETPYLVGHALGYTKLTELHNEWLKMMLFNAEDTTLQAHRGSYKTTCLTIAIRLLMLLQPKKSILFMRKTDADVKEVIRAIRKVIGSDFFAYWSMGIYGKPIRLTTDTATELNTNMCLITGGASQLTGLGLGSSITGKHYDYIFTDDIVNVNDRVSLAERNRTKLTYQELQNIKMAGTGRIFNTGTPWHKDDCFSIMPEARRYDCYSTGILSDREIDALKRSMTSALFRANYELRHIAEDDIIFTNPHTDAERALVEHGDGHIDASYGGSDYTAYTLLNKRDGKYYVFGKLYSKHIDDVTADILANHHALNGGKIYTELNADKGYLRKALRQQGERVSTYHESMNKYIKITSYLKGEWENVYFVAGTDKAYIEQILDYNENAEHDDAPDSLASMIRQKWRKKDSTNDLNYSIFN